MDFFQLLKEFSDWWRQNKRSPVQSGLAGWLDRLSNAAPETCDWNDQRLAQVVGVLRRIQNWKLGVKGYNQPAMAATLLSWFQLKHKLLELLTLTEPAGLIIRITRSNRRDAATISLRHNSKNEQWFHWPYDCMSSDARQKLEARRR